MKILFLTLARVTDIHARHIYLDLIRELQSRGHEPYIVCPVERRFKLPEAEKEIDGVKLLQVKTLNIQKTNVIEKGIGTLLLERQYMSAIKRHWGDVKFDLCLYSTPPITFNKVIAWQKKLGVPTYLLLKDIFPQNAVDLDMMKKGGLLHRLFRKKEEKLYALSDFIGCMSPANCKFVLDNNPSVDSVKVEVCPNSLAVLPQGIPADKSVRAKYGIPADKPLFIYGGNLGKPQGIDFLLQVLDKCKDRDDLHICVVGAGTESGKVKNWFNAANPKSVTVMDALPKQDYDQLVATADVGMIFLDHRFTIPNFPSRLLSYLENKIPVLAATDPNTDIGKIAESNGFGLWSISDNLDSTIKHINALASDEKLRKEMGQKGYEFFLSNYTIGKAADIILSHFDV